MAAAGAGALPTYTKEKVTRVFQDAPFYLISTHGNYNLNRPDGDWFFVVPPNTYIFETQQAGDLCLTTIDEPLWNMVQGENRDMFNCYFLNNGKGCPAPIISAATEGGILHAGKAAGAVHSARTYKQVFKQLTFYGPGERVPIRELSIGRVGTDSRISYAGMKLYALPHGKKVDRFPGTSATTFFEELHRQLIAHPDKIVTNKEMIDMVSTRFPDDPARVFFFSSCGAITPVAGSRARLARLNNIWNLQYAASLYAHSVGITSVVGPTTDDDSDHEERLHSSRYYPISRKGKQEAALFAPALSESDEAMRMPNTPLRAALDAAMEDFEEMGVVPCTGYGLYKLEGHTMRPIIQDGRACLTEKEVRALIRANGPGSYQIHHYNAAGKIVGVKTKQVGGYRKTRRRLLRVRRTRRLRVRR